MVVNIHEAKTHFSKLLQRVSAGEEITIAKAGVPVAQLIPVKTAVKVRKLGEGRGTIEIADDFDAPLPAAVLDAFYGRSPRRSSR
jgi:prevent-host-death family protein